MVTSFPSPTPAVKSSAPLQRLLLCLLMSDLHLVKKLQVGVKVRGQHPGLRLTVLTCA